MEKWLYSIARSKRSEPPPLLRGDVSKAYLALLNALLLTVSHFFFEISRLCGLDFGRPLTDFQNIPPKMKRPDKKERIYFSNGKCFFFKGLDHKIFLLNPFPSLQYINTCI